MKNNILLLLTIIFGAMTLNPLNAATVSYEDIKNTDCDFASKALTNLIEDIKEGLLTPKERKTFPGILESNLRSYKGDPEKCVLVNQDFVKVLSLDALAEFKDKKFKNTFIKLLSYLSKHQPGDIRQHAAFALAKMKAYDAVPQILRSARDRRTYVIGYRKAIEGVEILTIGELLKRERRDLRNDPFSFMITEALKSLTRKQDFDRLNRAIRDEYNLMTNGKSNWNALIRADMLRIAASSNPNEALELINMHSMLDPIHRLRAYAYIRNDKVIKPLSNLIKETAKTFLQNTAIDLNLALYMLANLGSKQSLSELEALANSPDQTVSYMAHAFLARGGNGNSAKMIKTKLLLMPDRLKIEGMKVIAELGDRNSVPLIKNIYNDANKKVKVYAIWALAKLKVTDMQSEVKKLMGKVKPKDERKAGLDMIGSLKSAVALMKQTEPVY